MTTGTMTYDPQAHATWFANRRWGWFVGIGIALALLGLVASTNLVMATMAATFVVAATMAAGGILMLIHAIGVRHWTWAAFWIGCGLIYLAASVAILDAPVHAAELLTFWLIILLGLSGVARALIAALARPGGWRWMLASGLVSIGLAIVVALGWPENALWVLGLLMAVDLLVQGMTLMMVGFALRSRHIA